MANVLIPCPACETPGWQFIPVWGFKPRLNSPEATVHSSRSRLCNHPFVCPEEFSLIVNNFFSSFCFATIKMFVATRALHLSSILLDLFWARRTKPPHQGVVLDLLEGCGTWTPGTKYSHSFKQVWADSYETDIFMIKRPGILVPSKSIISFPTVQFFFYSMAAGTATLKLKVLPLLHVTHR